MVFALVVLITALKLQNFLLGEGKIEEPGKGLLPTAGNYKMRNLWGPV